MKIIKQDIKEESQEYILDEVEDTDLESIVADFLGFIPYNEKDNVYKILYVKDNSVWILEKPILRNSFNNKYTGIYTFYKDKNKEV